MTDNVSLNEGFGLLDKTLPKPLDPDLSQYTLDQALGKTILEGLKKQQAEILIKVERSGKTAAATLASGKFQAERQFAQRVKTDIQSKDQGNPCNYAQPDAKGSYVGSLKGQMEQVLQRHQPHADVRESLKKEHSPCHNAPGENSVGQAFKRDSAKSVPAAKISNQQL